MATILVVAVFLASVVLWYGSPTFLGFNEYMPHFGSVENVLVLVSFGELN